MTSTTKTVHLQQPASIDSTNVFNPLQELQSEWQSSYHGAAVTNNLRYWTAFSNNVYHWTQTTQLDCLVLVTNPTVGLNSSEGVKNYRARNNNQY